MSLLAELKRRNVIRMAGLYLVGAWLITQVVSTFTDKYGSDQPGVVAAICAYRGDADAAFQWLDKAAAVHDPQIASLLSEPLFDSLRGDARWLPFLSTIGYAPEQIAKIEFKVTLPR